MPDRVPDWTQKFGYGPFIHLDHHRPGFARMMQGEKFFREIASNCWDPQVRMDEYAAFNTQVQVVCTIPVLFSYWAKPSDGHDISRFLNDHLAGICQRYPSNYIGLATVPMQDTQLAIEELTRCKEELGMKGVQIGSNINDHNLGEDRFFAFFKACEALDMAVLVHPWNMMGKSSMEKYWLPWLVGMPAETSRAICSMIFSGTLEQLPNLRVCFAHASGSFLSTIGRIEHGFNCRPDLVAVDNPINPREYLGKFWIDCITHDFRMLEYVVEMMGADKVCLGTDYPFPLGDLEFGRFIEESPRAEALMPDIFTNAPLAWLGMSADELTL